jgi:hypothetical protein
MTYASFRRFARTPVTKPIKRPALRIVIFVGEAGFGGA